MDKITINKLKTNALEVATEVVTSLDNLMLLSDILLGDIKYCRYIFNSISQIDITDENCREKMLGVVQLAKEAIKTIDRDFPGLEREEKNEAGHTTTG